MQIFWIDFSDGTSGCCEGQNAYDAIQIAEKLTGKTVINTGDNKYEPKLDCLPYPATPIIWQFDHPVYGVCPAFCYSPTKCRGRTCCPKERACDD